MIEVLILCEYPTLNGGERSMLAVAESLAASDVALSVAGPPTGPLAVRLNELQIPVLPFETHDADGRRRDRSALHSRLADIFRRQSPHVVHANSVSMTRLSGPVVAAERMRGVGHLRDIVKLSCGAMADINRHARILAVSEATRLWHVRQGLDAEKSRTLHNGVSLHEFAPRPPGGSLHRELGLEPAVPLVAAIGQIGIRKGLDVFLAAARILAESGNGLSGQRKTGNGPPAHFVIVGRRSSEKDEARRYERELHRVANEVPLAGRVHFLGVRPDVHDLLNEVILLVHAARQEPLGRVLLEAAASGTPVVATDVGGTREIFPDDSAARIVPPDSSGRLAAAILDLLQDGSLRTALSRAGRAIAEGRFDARVSATRLLEHWKQVAD